MRNIGAIEGNKPASDNDWEKVAKGGDQAIKTWINGQLEGKTCAIILAGAATANRKWINYEIVTAWDNRLGVVAIHIHGLKNLQGFTASKGDNPLNYIGYASTGSRLSATAKCYDPGGTTSKERYDWIATHLSNAVEEAIDIRSRY